MRPDSGKPCLNVRPYYTTYAAALLDDQPTAAQRLLCALGTQPVGKGSFESFNVKILLYPRQAVCFCGIIEEGGFAWPGVLGVGVSRRQVGGLPLFSSPLPKSIQSGYAQSGVAILVYLT